MTEEARHLANLIAYSVQLAVMIGVAAALARGLRSRDARLSLRYWQAMVVVMFALLAVQLAPTFGLAPTPGRGTAEVWLGGLSLAEPALPAWLPGAGLLLTALAVGCVLRLLWIGVGIVALRRIVKEASPLTDSAPEILELEEALDCRARYLLSARLGQPVTFGWRRATVLLPESFLGLEPDRRAAVICHELLHVRRRDWIPFLFEEGLRTVLWFHPAVRYLLSRIDLAREQVIDAEVVELLGRRRLYLDVLLGFAGQAESRRFVPATPFFRDRHLVERVRTLVKGPSSATMPIVLRAIAWVLISGLAAGVAAWAVPLRFDSVPLIQPTGQQEPVAFDVGDGITRPIRISGEPPLYTEVAREGRVQGTVILRATIDASGRVSELEPLKSVGGGLTESAMEAVAEWRFDPATLDGRPVAVYYNLTVNFRLE